MTANAFAKEISLKRSENIYQIKKGNNGISKELAGLIVERFPEINKMWLILGEGNMFADKLTSGTIEPNNLKSVPYYDMDLATVIDDRNITRPTYYISMPMVEACDFSFKFHGPAMEPAIKQGSVVFVQHSKSDYVLYGEMYLVVTESFIVTRYLRKCENDEYIELAVANPQHKSIEIKRCDIKELYIVKGSLTIFV